MEWTLILSLFFFSERPPVFMILDQFDSVDACVKEMNNNNYGLPEKIEAKLNIKSVTISCRAMEKQT